MIRFFEKGVCTFGTFVSFLGFNHMPLLWSRLGIATIWVVGEWYTSVILVVYLLFPIYRWLFKKHRMTGTIVMAAVYGLNLMYFLKNGGSIWMSYGNVMVYFWIGMLFAEYKQRITKAVYAIDVLLVIVLGSLLPLGIIDYMDDSFSVIYTLVFSVGLFVALYRVPLDATVVKYVSNVSYEVYLLHHRVFLIFLPLLITNESNGKQVLIVFVGLFVMAFLLAELLNRVYGALMKGVLRRR
ncbi:MAG: hypothetical protein Q4B73_09420 [Lachnospiraceae bacterium]|nr:hypothetical protein [Lachnospiraceae bacterium]